MNPLSPFTYYRRHKRHTLLLVTLVALVTLGVYLMVGMLHPVVEHSAATVLGPLTCFSLVYPAGDASLEPAVVSQIRAHPGVSQVIPENGSDMYVNVPSLAIQNSLKVLGLSEADIQILMDTCDLRLKEGRLLRPRTNEILLSEEVANALGLRLGDQIARSFDENLYRAILTPMVLVGILESDPSAPDILPTETPSALRIGPSARSRQRVRVAIVSYEYLASHELYSPRQSGFLVVPQSGRKAAVDDFLENTVRSPHTRVETLRWRAQLVARGRRMFNLIFAVVDCLVAAIVALVIGMINQIALTRRLADLGVLHAIGHHKNRLIRRLTLETTILAGVGWMIGLVLSWLALAWLKAHFYEPKGVELNLTSPAPLSFAAPIPLATVGFVAFSLVRVFARLDAVAIIERGKLSTEAQIHSSATKRSSSKPLSSWTFYLRHRRLGLILVVTMGLMILGVAFPVFFFSPLIDAEPPFFLNYLRYVGEVKPGVGRAVDPGLIAQIRSHPAVARVVHATLLHLAISVPPATETVALIYGVSEADLPYLVDLFGLHLKEGHLPRARSNEIVLSETLAKNRRVHVGDTVGQPVYERDDSIPSEMVVVGILQQRTAHPRAGQTPSSSDIALGFVSSEYVEGHELYSSRSVHLLVVPAEGHKAELDRWLEENIASTQTLVGTYDTRLHEMRQATRNMFLLFAAIESVVAVVAATALAALNTIFFAQRRDEFGLLHAVGRSRTWLILRTTKETISVVVVAWLIGAAVCIVGLLYAQANVYTPIGLRLNLLNLSPWLFTFPIPVTVVAASTGTIAHMLSKLDPISIIERR
jgi:ABC-type lipoprotein release transport system permease subunit